MGSGAEVDGADGVDDVGGGEGMGFGDFGGARAAPVERAAFAQEAGAGGGVDGAVLGGGELVVGGVFEVGELSGGQGGCVWGTHDATAPEKRFIGCVDDACCCQRCDGAFEERDLGVQAVGRLEAGIGRG